MSTLFVAALSCLLVSDPTPAAIGWTPPRVQLQPPEGPIAVDSQPWVRVTIENDASVCRPLLITGIYFVPGENRPETQLDFTIVDESGKRMERRSQGALLRPHYTLTDLMVLRCGASYSWRVPLDRPEWHFALTPGKYKVRAVMTNRLRSFFEQDRVERRRLFKAFGLDEEYASELLRDFTVESNEVELELLDRR